MNIHLKAKHPFWLKGGKPLQSLRELHDELKTMTPDVWEHHVNSSKNDFAAWLEHSLGHPTLAAKLRSTDRTGHLAHIGEALAPPKNTAKTTAPKTPCEPKIIVSNKRTMLAIHAPREVVLSGKKTELALAAPRHVISNGRKTNLQLHHAPHRIVSSHKTPLALIQHYERILSENKTLLALTHPTELAHHGLAIISYLSLGIVFGAGLVILFLAL